MKTYCSVQCTEKKGHRGAILETKSKPLKSFRKKLRYYQIDC